jgi:hypothetical protein
LSALDCRVQAEEKVNSDVALDRALKTSSLTFEGKPFHAVMKIGKDGQEYSGRIEFWWVNSTKYRVAVRSPSFNRTTTVNRERVSEIDDGDYYPKWLESFVLAVMDPVPMGKNVRGRGLSVDLGVEKDTKCIRRDDRTDGNADYLTYGVVCFVGTEPRLDYLNAFNYSMSFGDWKKFDGKQIPRIYTTHILNEENLVGHLTTLDELKSPDENMFEVDDVTPPDQKVSTAFVSTQTAEGLAERAPVIQWPPVREGNTEGSLTLYARTDRTGQVREVMRYDADRQPALAVTALEQAVNYKFKPLVVNGVAEQMEMPLVIRFSTKIADPMPVLSVADMAKQTISCKPKSIPQGLLPKGTVVTLRVTVNVKGETVNVRPSGDACAGSCTLLIGPQNPISECKFAPYSQNGRATLYKGDVEITAP